MVVGVGVVGMGVAGLSSKGEVQLVRLNTISSAALTGRKKDHVSS